MRLGGVLISLGDAAAVLLAIYTKYKNNTAAEKAVHYCKDPLNDCMICCNVCPRDRCPVMCLCDPELCEYLDKVKY